MGSQAAIDKAEGIRAAWSAEHSVTVTAPPVTKDTRLKELDALRGLAACVVVFCHFYNLHEPTKQPFAVQVMFRGLFRFLVAGHEAVMLFFVLSGFVLTFPFLKDTVPRYSTFLVKRVCRIYLPYLGAVMLAAGCDVLFRSSIPTLSPWFQMIWSHPLTWNTVLQHATLIGNFSEMELNGAFWSLVIEMRVSIIFPLLILLLKPIRTWKAALYTASLVLCMGVIPFRTGNTLIGILVSTLHASIPFVIGSLLARNLTRSTGYYNGLSRRVQAAAWLLIILAFSFTSLLASRPWLLGLYDMILTVAAAGCIVIAISDAPIRSFLQSSIPQYLGAVSYSVYLLHVTVLLSLVHAFYPRVSLGALFPMYLVLTFLLSTLFHIWVETPSMHLGSWLGRRI